jgi:hypothetical protein
MVEVALRDDMERLKVRANSEVFWANYGENFAIRGDDD